MEPLDYTFDMDGFMERHPDLAPDLRPSIEPSLTEAEDATFRFVMGLLYG